MEDNEYMQIAKILEEIGSKKILDCLPTKCFLDICEISEKFKKRVELIIKTTNARTTR